MSKKKLAGSKGGHRRFLLLALAFGVNQSTHITKGTGAIGTWPPFRGIDAVTLVTREINRLAAMPAARGTAAVPGVAPGSGGSLLLTTTLAPQLALVGVGIFSLKCSDLVYVAGDVVG